MLAMWLGDTRPVIGLNSYEKARFIAMVRGTAHTPFVYRVLVPWIVRAGRALLGDHRSAVFTGWVFRTYPALWKVFLYLGWEHVYLPEYLLAAGTLYASLIAFVATLRALCRRLYVTRGWVADVVGLAALLGLPIYFHHGTHYLYDLPTLFFFALGLLALARDDHRLLYLTLGLGSLNKETLALLILVFAARHWRRLPWPRYLAHLAALGALALGIKAALWWLFRPNPGGLVEFHLWINLYHGLTRPYTTSDVVTFLAIALLVGYGLRQKPLLLRQSLVILPPLYVSYVVWGIHQEIRVFYELYPALLLLAAQSVTALLEWPLLTAPDGLAIGRRAGSSPTGRVGS